LSLLAVVLLLGGGRRLLQAIRARRAVARAAHADITPDEIDALANHGRPALIELFRIQATAAGADQRAAAGRALARLWARDQLVAEEEKAIVSRGFEVAWRARRRYPRSLRGPIPIRVDYGVAFLIDDSSGISPKNLQWSHRITGAERASLETFSPWQASPGRAEFSVEPADLAGNGPHRLVLQVRARTVGLTSAWELELPHVRLTFELDPQLAVGALLTAPDSTRGGAIHAAVRLTPPTVVEPHSPLFLPLNGDLALRDPPGLRVRTPLPCDLAHSITIELEGVAGQFPAGSIVVSGQGVAGTATAECDHPIGPLGVPPGALDGPGARRMRAILAADADLAWTDPDVRSVWPETVVTDWCPVRIVRR
jgi:hypothetical protein